MGQLLEDNDFYTIMMGSLLGSYDPYIYVNTTLSVLGKTLSTNDLMLTVTKKYEQCTMKNKGGKKDENSAFYSNDSKEGSEGRFE